MQKFLHKLATDQIGGIFPATIKFLLFILSIIYATVIRTLSFIYLLNPRKVPCKVISVGNITLGGTGKTVVVEYIARLLKIQGRKVAIITRGYGKEDARHRTQDTSYASMGDEAYMLQGKLNDIPVIVDADRIRAANTANKDYHADKVVLDDGFQQWRLFKDLDIVLIDTTDPFGNRQMIPRGILREPLASLKRANIFILTKTNLNPNVEDVEEFLLGINPQALIMESTHSPVGLYKFSNREEILDLSALKGKNITLFCGIGDPDSFENLVEGLGANIGLSFKFPDHHRYSQNDLDKIMQESEMKGIDTIITTEKDAARLHRTQDTGHRTQVFVLQIELKITKNEEKFHSRLLGL